MGFKHGEWLVKAVQNGQIDPADLCPPPQPQTQQEPAQPRTARKPSEIRTSAKPRLIVVFDVPVKTKSEANAGGKLKATIARKKSVKEITREHLPGTLRITYPVRVTLTRCGAKLDSDNLRRALKSVRDVVAEWLGIDDGDEGRGGRVVWRYRQRAAWVPFVRVRVECG